MKPALIIVALLCAFVGFGFFCYRKGQSDANAKAALERQTEYGNDWNSDAAVPHSTSYSFYGICTRTWDGRG